VTTVSVLMTVYNREAYLADAIQSVLNSTFTDFELIIVDDRSKDRSPEIAESFRDRDSRIQMHVNPQNLGDYGNRMRAASLARGTYLKYVDSDDLIYPHGLEVMVRNMQSAPEAAVAIAHPLPEESLPYPILLTPEQAYRRQFLQRGCMGCGPSGAIIRRDVFESLGGFRPEWGVLADLEFWQRVAALHPILLQQPALTWWRVHEGQEYRIGDAEKVYLERGYKVAIHALMAEQCPLNSKDRQKALLRVNKKHARRIISVALKSRQPALALSAFRQSNLSSLDLVLSLFQSPVFSGKSKANQ
jgi:glycosyltransferase involved in cell wall biosynthesis